MTSYGVHHDEMNEQIDISERDAERLLAGDRTPDLRGLGDVAAFLDAMGDAFPEETQPAEASAHLAAMMAAAVPTASTGPEHSGVPRLFASRRARFAALVLAAMLAFSGAAFAGVLPAGVQRAVSRAAGVIGLSVPSPKAPDAAEHPLAPAAGTSREESGTETETVQPGDQKPNEEAAPADSDTESPDETPAGPSSNTDEHSSDPASAGPAEGGAQSPAVAPAD